MKTKYIFVTGGVVSSLGKGLASASIGALMESRGLTVTLQKMDPYIRRADVGCAKRALSSSMSTVRPW